MSLANTPTSLLFSNWQRLAITRISVRPKSAFSTGQQAPAWPIGGKAAAALQGIVGPRLGPRAKEGGAGWLALALEQYQPSGREYLKQGVLPVELDTKSATWQPLHFRPAGAGITPQAKGRHAVRCELRRGTMAKQLLRVRAALRSVHELTCVLCHHAKLKSLGVQGVKTEGLRLRLVDAKEKVVGRLAAHIAMLLQARRGPASSLRPSAAPCPSTLRCCSTCLYG